jgi:non-heme chloroperoxidase
MLISGEKDHTVLWAVTNASDKQQGNNQSVTEIVEIKNRGRALTVDSGWRKVADTASRSPSYSPTRSQPGRNASS